MQFTNLKIAAVAIGLGVLGAVPASAAVVPAPSQMPKAGLLINTSALGAIGAAGQDLSTSAVEKARWRGRRYYRPRYRSGRWIAPAIIAGTAAVIIGGSIAQSQARYRDRWQMCADRYISFSWADGTFQPYEGPRRVCPYLLH